MEIGGCTGRQCVVHSNAGQRDKNTEIREELEAHQLEAKGLLELRQWSRRSMMEVELSDLSPTLGRSTGDFG